jgi:3-phosphoshikimate 1-carboxyvinyltransferase
METFEAPPEETMNDTQDKPRVLHPRRSINGTLTLPGDKSISHRAALISLLCKEPLRLLNYSDGEDCKASLEAIRKLGADVQQGSDGSLTVTLPKERGSDPVIIDCGNSGTTCRLLLGLLAGAGITAELIGDESLSSRPMKRVADPLTLMGASIVSGSLATSSDDSDSAGTSDPATLPLRVLGGANESIDYRLPVASAQVKSAILLAAVSSGATAIVTEDVITRDHTERMLQHLGANISVKQPRLELTEDPNDPRKKIRTILDDWKTQVIVKGSQELTGGEIDIPGDISTAAFFFAAAAIGGGEITVKNLGLNPTRTAFLDHLKAIGCDVKVSDKEVISSEPRGNVTVTGGALRGRRISGAQTAALIDELPIIAVLACFAEGPTVIRDARELRVKETDRIDALTKNLRVMGAHVGELEDGLAIEAKNEMQPGDFNSYGDHRIAMALSVAALFLSGDSTLTGADAVTVSCPTFFELLDSITA